MAILRTAILTAGSALLLSGCQLQYLIKSGYHQANLLRSRVPIEEALRDPSLSEDFKRKLRLVEDVRRFAESDLGLKPTKNYTSFVDLHRDYVTWAVSAAPKNKLEHHLFKYPIVGALPYKGFFDKPSADEEAAQLDKQGLDTYVRGVTAYSTLGWFRDPVLSSMLRSADHDLANLIIHETTHATLYIKSAADFNERLATFLGDIGTEIFYRKREGPDSPTLHLIQKENADQRRFSKFITQEIETMKKWYSSQSSPSEELRTEQFKELRDRFKVEVLPQLETSSYRQFGELKLNNARLLAFQTYLSDLSDFERAFEKHGRDFRKFLEYCKTLEREQNPERALKSFAGSI